MRTTTEIAVIHKALFCFVSLWAAVAAQRSIKDIAALAQGKVGVACSIDGAEADCNFHAHDHFPMQSVYKLPIAMAMLDAIEDRAFVLDQSVRFLPSDRISPDQHSPLRDEHPAANVDVPLRELLRLAVSESDGVASDILLRLLGGPLKVDAYVRRLGIQGIKIADTEQVLGRDVTAQYRNYAEPAAMVALLNQLFRNHPLNPEHTKLLLRWMTETSTGPNRIRKLLPVGTVVAHKTGTSGTDGGPHNVTNDVGLITLPDGRQLAVAIFVTDSRANQAIRESVIAKIARLIWDQTT